MGSLTYGFSGISFTIDDRALTHLEVVIVGKLRRGEGCAFTFETPQVSGGGRTTVWLDRSVPLVFHFEGSRRPKLNMAWLEALSQAAMTNAGLHLVPEPNPVTSLTDQGGAVGSLAARGQASNS